MTQNTLLTKITSFECVYSSENKNVYEHLSLWASRLSESKMETLEPQASAVPGPDPASGTHYAGLQDSSNTDTSSGPGGPVSSTTSHAEVVGATMVSNVEAVTKKVTLTNPVVLPSMLANSADDSTDPSIKLYMGKPTKLASGVLSSSDVAGTFSKYTVFEALKNNNLYYNKLVGSFSFRADTVVTLQVNANRFQAGRYILAYLPLGGAYTSDTAYNDYISMKTFTATQVTQLLHVELDLATDTQVQLRIPYNTYANSTPVARSGVAFTALLPGLFFLYPYMAVLAGSSTTEASYTLWVHYENVELFGNMAPQMGFLDPGRGTSGSILNKGKEAVGMEVLHAGPVETIFNKARGVSSSIASVPALSAFAGPVTWLLDILGGVSSVFGWSKPINIEPVNNVSLNMFNTIGNCDTKDPVASLSLIQNNHVDVLPGFSGTGDDELSINFLKSIYAFWNVYNWSTSANSGDNIFIIPLDPSNFYNEVTDSATKIISAVPITWLSTYFSSYRGGLKFKFKIVKTEFHSGRLIFGFFPIDPMVSMSTLSVTFANLDYVQKTVVDIRENSEFEIEVPFISTTSYKPLGGPAQGNATPALGTPLSYGYLGCWVLSDLVAPDGVTSTIKILTEVAGAKDLEFACPRNNVFAPIIPLSISAAPQMGDFTGEVSLGEIGTTDSKALEYNDAAACVGEAVISMRQLLKRPGTFLSYSNYKTVILRPQAISPLLNVTTSGPVATGLACDLYTMLGCTFAYYRGGIRFKIIPSTMSTVNQSLINCSLQKLPYVTTGGYYRTIMSSTSGATALNANVRSNYERGGNFAFQRYDWGLGLSIPFYSGTHSKPTLMAWSGSVTSSRYVWQPSLSGSMDLELTLLCDSADLLNATYLRYGADDCNFGHFTGVPPIFRYDYA
jgi:hypothetical protein